MPDAVYGNPSTNVNSTTPISFNVYDYDILGELHLISLWGVIDIELVFTNILDLTEIRFKASLLPSQVVWLLTGLITFTPLASDFTQPAVFNFVILVQDSEAWTQLPTEGCNVFTVESVV